MLLLSNTSVPDRIFVKVLEMNISEDFVPFISAILFLYLVKINDYFYISRYICIP